MKALKYFLLIAICGCTLPIRAQNISDSSRSLELPDSGNGSGSRPWLMGALSLDIVEPNVGNDLNVFGYGFKGGVTWPHMVLMLANHSTRGELNGTPEEEHRYDYALLFGYSYRSEHTLLNIGIGPSRIDYTLRGNVIMPPSSPSGTAGVWQVLNGPAYGLAMMANIFMTRFTYFGIGTGLYCCLAKNVSYFALEFSLIELNLPL